MLDKSQDAIGSGKKNTLSNGAVADSSSSSKVPSADSKATNMTPEVSNYNDYKMMPESPWPPPIFVRKNVSPEERYYLEHRWNSQWRFFDKKATENKTLYFRTQLIIGIGSVIVPALVSFNPTLASLLAQVIPSLTESLARNLVDLVTVVVSLSVAVSAAIESLNKYGENWGTYRQAAEELQAEKSLYDVNAGQYANTTDRFPRFVEQCEGIIAKQNGRYMQTVERQNQESAARTQKILEQRDKDTDDERIVGAG
jgi:hypothetical protein